VSDGNGNEENAPIPFQALNSCQLKPRSLIGQPLSSIAPSRGDTATLRKPTWIPGVREVGANEGVSQMNGHAMNAHRAHDSAHVPEVLMTTTDQIEPKHHCVWLQHAAFAYLVFGIRPHGPPVHPYEQHVARRPQLATADVKLLSHARAR
jgi:hypothetical protein